MHTAEQILAHGGSPVTTQVLDQTDHSVFWKECATCLRIKPPGQFRRDSSYREGVRDQCLDCESSPRLSTEEHTVRLREQNYYSHQVRDQRWKHQLDWIDSAPRWGQQMHAFEFLYRLKHVVGENGDRLFWMDGRVFGDLALFRLNRLGPEYMMYVPTEYSMPEFSIMEFDGRDVPVKERYRGWRTILLRLIKPGVISEQQSINVFGEASGPASTPWRRQLFVWRNGHE